MTMVWVLVFAYICQYISAESTDFPKENSLNFLYKSMKNKLSSKKADPLPFTDDVDPGKPLILTPFIEQNKLAEAREAARVDANDILPGFESYAGFLTVNKEYNANLWFWYFPVANKSVEDTPWIIWLQGGPGCSSLFGLFNEIGPFSVDKDYKVKEKEYSWGKNHSLLFIDSPVGSGFSFTDDERGFVTNQTMIGENLYSVLQQFLTIFPELRRAPLFIAGESYSGKSIPALGIQILWHREKDEHINLQGLAIGDGFIDPVTLLRYSYFVREAGLVDDKTADFMLDLEKNATDLIEKGNMKRAQYVFDAVLDPVSNAGINLYNYVSNDHPDKSFINYVQSNVVRRALHVGNVTYDDCNSYVISFLTDFLVSAKPWLEELLNNYRVMLYNGQLDVIVAYHCSVNTHRSLVYNGSDEYHSAKRRQWYHNDVLAGFYKKGGNLTEVMVRGAGHMVPSDQPAAALGLISAFVRGQDPDQTL